MKKIETGDTVYIRWQDRHGVWMPPEPVTILRMPAGAGDFLQVQYGGGAVQAIPPNRSDYILERK